MSLKNTNQQGFTIVELLIVIVVIAILAAISIVAFTGVQQRGRDSGRASDINSISKALTAYTAQGSSDGGGDWPASAAGTSVLGTFSTATVDATTLGKINAAAPDASNKDRYGYTPLCSGTPLTPSGARLQYFKEQNNTVVTVNVGTGAVAAVGSPAACS